MGFFSAKATCGVCENQVGLNRFKIKKSNAWICPTCLTLCGGASKINVSKVTIEELRAIINTNNLKNVNGRICTASAMYDYCIQNQFGSGQNENWGMKHFKVIEDNLMNNEEVLMAFIGLHNYKSVTKHENNYAYAITNKRILLGQKNALAGQDFHSISLKNINDITFNSGALFGIVTIDTIKETFSVGLDKQSASNINIKIHETLDKVQSNAQVSPNTQSSISVPDELIKFKQLLDSGIITQEDFDRKKEQLLSL